MSLKTLMPAFRTPRLLWATAAALVAMAAPASALLGLPIGLPMGVDASERIDTPLGPIDVAAGEQGADACYDLATPALPLPAAPAIPALPSLPVPLPVAVPALPAVPAVSAPSAGSDACVSAGLDGASADVGIDAAGNHVGTAIDADVPAPADDIGATVEDATSTVEQTAQDAGGDDGFFGRLVDTLFGWI